MLRNKRDSTLGSKLDASKYWGGLVPFDRGTGIIGFHNKKTSYYVVRNTSDLVVVPKVRHTEPHGKIHHLLDNNGKLIFFVGNYSNDKSFKIRINNNVEIGRGSSQKISHLDVLTFCGPVRAAELAGDLKYVFHCKRGDRHTTTGIFLHARHEPSIVSRAWQAVGDALLNVFEKFIAVNRNFDMVDKDLEASRNAPAKTASSVNNMFLNDDAVTALLKSSSRDSFDQDFREGSGIIRRRSPSGRASASASFSPPPVESLLQDLVQEERQKGDHDLEYPEDLKLVDEDEESEVLSSRKCTIM